MKPKTDPDVSSGEQTSTTPDGLKLGITLLRHIEGQLSRADTKAQFTLTVDAILMASTTLLGKSIVINSITYTTAPSINQLIAVLSILMFTSLLISTVFALLAVMPRLTPASRVPNNLFYFGTIVQEGEKKIQESEKKFIEQFTKQSPEEIRQMVLSEVHGLARIARDKFKWIRMSHYLLFVALVFWAGMQVLAIFTKTVPMMGVSVTCVRTCRLA